MRNGVLFVYHAVSTTKGYGFAKQGCLFDKQFGWKNQGKLRRKGSRGLEFKGASGIKTYGIGKIETVAGYQGFVKLEGGSQRVCWVICVYPVKFPKGKPI
jgi:hypothetical protein